MARHLTTEQKQEIYRLYNAEPRPSIGALARLMGVTRRTVSYTLSKQNVTVQVQSKYTDEQIMRAIKEHKTPKAASAQLGCSASYFRSRWAKIRNGIVDNFLNTSLS